MGYKFQRLKMGLEEVESDIKKKIDAQVSAITSDAEKEANVIINKGKEQLFELKKTRELEVQKTVGELKTRELAQANLAGRKLKLDAKKDAIDSVFSRVEEKLLGLGAADKKEILSALIDKAKRELQGAKYVSCSKEDRKIVDALASRAGLQFSSTISCKGGIVVETGDRTVCVDLTYEMLLKMFKKNKIKDIAEQLFSKK